MSAFDDGASYARAHPFIARIVLGALIVLAIAAAFAWQRHKYAVLEGNFHAIALKSSNDSARLDSTRRVIFGARDSAKFLGDSLQAVTRLVVQSRPSTDALDRALAQMRTANTQLAATIKSLGVTQTSVSDVKTDTSTDTRSASFVVDSTPYHVRADVALPRVGAGKIALGVRLDTAHVTVRTGCTSSTNENGIRAARVSLLSPPWLALNVTSSEQDDQVCNRVEAKGRGWWGFPDVIAGAGWTVNAKGARLGVFVGAGLRVGP